MNLKQNKGQVLVESIIALSVLTIGFLSLIGLLNSSIGLTKVANESYVATYLAAEGIEIVKNMIDDNNLNPGLSWNQGLGNGDYEADYKDNSLHLYQGNFLKFDSDDGYNYARGENTLFKRKITIQNLSSDSIKVISIVNWTSRGGVNSEVKLEDVFYK